MATTATPRVSTTHPANSADRAASATWPLYAVVFSSACIVIGLIWDISWHSTIGRDTFWTLPHLLEQLGAIVAGLSCGWLVLSTTFGGRGGKGGSSGNVLGAGDLEAQRAASVRFWGFLGPLGAWVTIWGTILMITSAPFDNWWHNAYGLDVKIVSPPHMVLGLGMLGIQVGALLLAVALQNRTTDQTAMKRLGWVYALAGGIIVAMVATIITEYSSRGNDMHNALFYQVAGGALPIFLVAFARSGRLRFPATTAATLYMALLLGMLWILPLFPAQPLLAPIYNPLSHMVPPQFPLLLVIPAFAIDLLLQRAGRRHDWIMAVVLGLSFVGLLLAVQWFLGEFLVSPASLNAVFGAERWPYFVRPGAWQHEFWGVPEDATGRLDVAALGRGIGIAALIAMASARIGLWFGNGMSRVMR